MRQVVEDDTGDQIPGEQVLVQGHVCGGRGRDDLLDDQFAAGTRRFPLLQGAVQGIAHRAVGVVYQYGAQRSLPTALFGQVTKDAIPPGGVTSEPTQFLLGRSGKDRFQVGAYIGGPGQLYRQFPVTWGVGSQFGVGRVDAGLDLGGGRTIAEASVDTALGGPKGCVALPGGT